MSVRTGAKLKVQVPRYQSDYSKEVEPRIQQMNPSMKKFLTSASKIKGLPDLRRAGSNISTRFVAATT